MAGKTSETGRKRKAADTALPPRGIAQRNQTTMVWLSVALVALTVVVFAPVRHFSFVSWDDPSYVSENPVVSQGLTPSGIVWAMTGPGRFYWHPVTWLSHMADVHVFGLHAGAHHVTNLVLHVAGTLILFWVLRRITGQIGRSAFVAPRFAVHPLHVESVAWIAERKDVLSGVFWMLTLWAYVSYVRNPGRARYTAVVAFFGLGLMSKPTLVTLPLVLLLLDVWPLGRTGVSGASPAVPIIRLVVEKIPLFALSIAGSLVTVLAQFHVGAVQSLETVPVGERLSNAAVSSVSYIVMALWPSRLAPFYPYRPIAGWWVLCCLLILVGVSYAAVRAFRRRPYLIVGWLWYLVALLPVLGFVQVGSQSMADRFTYLPLVGLLVAFAWRAGDLLASLRVHKLAAGAAALAMLAAFGGAARAQVGYWKDSETLWRRAVDVVPNNDLAHANLGLVLVAARRPDEALAHFSEAMRIISTPDPRTGTGRGTPPPEYAALLHSQIGLLLGRQGRLEEAKAFPRSGSPSPRPRRRALRTRAGARCRRAAGGVDPRITRGDSPRSGRRGVPERTRVGAVSRGRSGGGDCAAGGRGQAEPHPPERSQVARQPRRHAQRERAQHGSDSGAGIGVGDQPRLRRSPPSPHRTAEAFTVTTTGSRAGSGRPTGSEARECPRTCRAQVTFTQRSPSPSCGNRPRQPAKPPPTSHFP